MSYRSNSFLQKGISDKDALIGIIALCALIGLGYQVYGAGINFFFERHEASQEKLNETVRAQGELQNAVLSTFYAWPRLDVRNDYSVHAYISRQEFDQVPFPDRDKAITKIGETWCDDKRSQAT